MFCLFSLVIERLLAPKVLSRVDLTLVINLNSAMTTTERDQVVQDLNNFMSFLRIANDGTRVAIVAYDGTSAEVLSLLSGSSDAVTQGIEGLKRWRLGSASAGAAIAPALRTVVDSVYSTSNSRSDVGKWVIMSLGRTTVGETSSVSAVMEQARRATERKIGVTFITYYGPEVYDLNVIGVASAASWRRSSPVYGLSPVTFLTSSARSLVLYGQAIISNFGENYITLQLPLLSRMLVAKAFVQSAP